MARFPKDRVYRRRSRRSPQSILTTLILAALLIAAWHLDDRKNQRVPVQGQATHIADGDSFSIGARKLRLRGIDAPEYHQTCKDAAGTDWPCGRTSRAALEKLLTEPGLACKAEAHDRYARSLATCRSSQTADIAAAQVRDGMAVSDEYYGSRSFGEEEDAAKAAKRGVWQGEFTLPENFRALAK
jgi:endonuclease YncB( thermonuclease family)